MSEPTHEGTDGQLLKLTIEVSETHLAALQQREPEKTPTEILGRALRYYRITDNAPAVLDERSLLDGGSDGE